MKEKITTKIVSSVSDIPSDAFDVLFKDETEARGFYKTLEETDIGPFKYYYLLILKDGQIVCIAPLFLINFNLDLFAPEKIQNIINKLRIVFKNLFCFKTLICGSPATDYAYIGFDKNFNNREELISIIYKEMENFAKTMNASSVGFKDFGDDFKELDILKKFGFVKVSAYPCVMQNLFGKNLDDFFSNLTADKRYDLKRKIKKINNLPALMLEVKDTLDNQELDRVFELYLNTFNQSDIHFEKLTKDFFVKIQENMRGIAKFFIYKVEDKIIGFNLCFVKNGLFLDKFLGFDYGYLYKYQLFFNRFFLNIDWCYKNSFNLYQSGQTGYDGKMRLLGRLKPLYIYGKHMNNFINSILKPIFLIAQPKNFDPIFKLMDKYEFKL